MNRRNRESASKRHHARQARALAFLRTCGGQGSASAIEIGAAAICGESWRGGLELKEKIGLAIAVALVRKGMVAFTRNNRFRIV